LPTPKTIKTITKTKTISGQPKLLNMSNLPDTKFQIMPY
jgi:hypothetical protein